MTPPPEPPSPTRAQEVRRLSAHPYLVSADLDDAASAVALRGPCTVDDVLDLAFGAADALVEAHRAGLTHGAIGPDAVVTLGATAPAGSEEHRLLAPPEQAVPGATPAADVADLAAALLVLLPDPSGSDEDDARLPATREVLRRAAAGDDGDLQDAAALRDAVAAIRLGAPPSAPRPADISAGTGGAPAGTPGGRSGDRTGVRDVSGAADPAPVGPDPDPGGRRGPSGLLIGMLITTVVLAVLLVLLVTHSPF